MPASLYSAAGVQRWPCSYAALIKLLRNSLLLALLLSCTPNRVWGGRASLLVFQQQPTYPIPAWAGGWGVSTVLRQNHVYIHPAQQQHIQPSSTVAIYLSNPARRPTQEALRKIPIHVIHDYLCIVISVFFLLSSFDFSIIYIPSFIIHI